MIMMNTMIMVILTIVMKIVIMMIMLVMMKMVMTMIMIVIMMILIMMITLTLDDIDVSEDANNDISCFVTYNRAFSYNPLL